MESVHLEAARAHVPHGARRWLGTGVITYPIRGGLELSPGCVGAVDFGD